MAVAHLSLPVGLHGSHDASHVPDGALRPASRSGFRVATDQARRETRGRDRIAPGKTFRDGRMLRATATGAYKRAGQRETYRRRNIFSIARAGFPRISGSRRHAHRNARDGISLATGSAPDRRDRKYEEIAMSIVATYTFALQHGGHVTFYIARNGCPSGAALYFLAAHLADGDGSLADRFHRANKAAELTSADGHDDLSYRYAVDLDGHLHAFRHDGELLEWEQFFSGHYAEFINGHAPLKVLGDGVLKHVKTPGTGGSYEWVTRGQLVRRHAAAMETLSLQCERFPERADVIAGYRGDVDALALALQRYNECEDVE
ncbi:hypothetical protein [Burkholderia stagnalis]|uniref:hypothetical protein n=1 Tax=Burkholderia stagnalis TaxID=1503054 RepID=UPI001E59E44B|nr:hypothetical protein [Burkholderia stagnalis]